MPQYAMLQADEVPPGTLIVWVIYDSPTGHPGKFVLRPHFGVADVEDADQYGVVTGRIGRAKFVASAKEWPCSSLAEAQALVPPGAVHFGRQPDDDPKVLDVWMQ